MSAPEAVHQLAIAPNVVYAEAAFRWQLIQNDPDDNKFCDLALSVNADYLVSEDNDFDVFKKRSHFPDLEWLD